MNKYLVTPFVMLLACGNNQQPDLQCQRIEVTLPPQVGQWPFHDPPTKTDDDCTLWVPGRTDPYYFRDALIRNVNSFNLNDKASGGGFALQAYCETGKVVFDVSTLLSSANIEIYFTRTTEVPSSAQFDCKLTHRYYDYNAVVVRPGVCRPREDRDETHDWPIYSPQMSCVWERK